MIPVECLKKLVVHSHIYFSFETNGGWYWPETLKIKKLEFSAFLATTPPKNPLLFHDVVT